VLVGGAIQTASQSLTDLRTSSMFAQEQVTIAQRLFLTAGLNYEASSAFGADQRWQWFPRVGASYVLNEEPFWRSSLGNTFSTMRLRAAYGQTGGQPPGLYDRFENYISTTFAGKPGLIASTIASNPNLKPERQSEIKSASRQVSRAIALCSSSHTTTRRPPTSF
jgi:outer membrane receptor for ferrienterochelin and colicin